VFDGRTLQEAPSAAKEPLSPAERDALQTKMDGLRRREAVLTRDLDGARGLPCGKLSTPPGPWQPWRPSVPRPCPTCLPWSGNPTWWAGELAQLEARRQALDAADRAAKDIVWRTEEAQALHRDVQAWEQM
jgi:hypothetical protein